MYIELLRRLKNSINLHMRSKNLAIIDFVTNKWKYKKIHKGPENTSQLVIKVPKHEISKGEREKENSHKRSTN